MATMHATVAEEVRIGREYTPDIAWPTIRLAIGVYIILALSTWAAINGTVSLWLSAIVNTAVLYAAYTVIHEATHSNIVPRNSRLRWVNQMLGFAICIPLWMFFYPHRKSHMVHHAKCNTDDDPDIYARGPFGVVAFRRIPLTTLNYLNPVALVRDCRCLNLPARQRLVSYLTYAAYFGAVVAIVASGYAFELLCLWFLPWLIGNSIMLVFFTWIPHHPHTETGRYRNTRCSLWPGANFLTQGQNFHLVHHMMSWIPYYQYESVFRRILPYLEQNDAMIDGFWPRPAAARK